MFNTIKIGVLFVMTKALILFADVLAIQYVKI